MSCLHSTKKFLAKCGRETVRFIIKLQITVEPIMFILAFCNTAKSIVTPHLSEEKMKSYYPAPPGLSPDELKKFYNKKMVEWDNNYDYVNLPIACIVGIMYGGYSDYYGRKVPLIAGILSVIVETAMRMLVWSPVTNWSLHWLYPTAIVAGILGDFLLTMSCINAYVTDEFEDKRTLSIRMIILSILFSLGSFGASRLTKVMIKHMSHIAVLGIAEGLYAFSIILSLVMLSIKKPKTRRLLIEDQEELEDNEQDANSMDESFLGVIKLSFISIYDSAKIFLKKREGHCRIFLYLCFLANFLDQFVFGEEKSLIGTYTLLSPFNWDSDEYADYKSWRPIVQIAGMFFGMLVFKNLLKIRDTLIICFAIGSMGLSVLIIGLAQKTWEIYASLAPGSLHGLLNPLTYSFMSCIVSQNEVGKAYAISSIAQKLAGIAQTAILQNIYLATVDWYQGFVWLLMAGIAFVAVFIYVFVHIMAKRENIGI